MRKKQTLPAEPTRKRDCIFYAKVRNLAYLCIQTGCNRTCTSYDQSKCSDYISNKEVMKTIKRLKDLDKNKAIYYHISELLKIEKHHLNSNIIIKTFNGSKKDLENAVLSAIDEILKLNTTKKS